MTVSGRIPSDQVAPCVFGQHQVDVGEVIKHLAVQLLRHPLVEAAIARLEMKDRDLAALGRQDRETGIGVPVQQQRVGPLRGEHLVAFLDDPRDGLRGIGSGRVQEMVRLADFQVVEENLVQLVVVVLPGMDQYVPGKLLELRDDAAHLDELGPRADNRHDLKH